MRNEMHSSRNARPQSTPESASAPSEGIKIDGYQQVLEMLRAADNSFRESLLNRMSRQNPALVKALREALR